MIIEEVKDTWNILEYSKKTFLRPQYQKKLMRLMFGQPYLLLFT